VGNTWKYSVTREYLNYNEETGENYMAKEDYEITEEITNVVKFGDLFIFNLMVCVSNQEFCRGGDFVIVGNKVCRLPNCDEVSYQFPLVPGEIMPSKDYEDRGNQFKDWVSFFAK